MDVTFMPLSDKDVEELVKFLTTNSFPYHRITAPSEELVRQLIMDGRFEADDVRTYWVYGDNHRLGLAIVERLQSQCPTFDLRLVEEARGQGVGVPVLQALTGLVFDSQPQAHRFAGRTREDNVAMRKTFLRSGFLKEAHYRRTGCLTTAPGLRRLRTQCCAATGNRGFGRSSPGRTWSSSRT